MIFDPRYKIQFVEFCYKTLYGDGPNGSNECIRVREKLFSLFDEYMFKASKGASSSSYSKGISEDDASRNSDDLEKNDFFKVR